MPVITTIDDLKRLHKRRAPKMFYDYCESGSWTEQTFRENTSDFDQIRLRQRIAVDMSNRTLASTMIGSPVTMPVSLAPIGMGGMQCADGEIKAARAAEAFGVPLYPVHHVDLFHRRRARPYKGALLVPALRHAGRRFRRQHHRPRKKCRLLCPRADA